MIQVIKHGKQRYEMTCPVCRCQFSFDDTDVEKIGPPHDRYVRIQCPDCRHKFEGWDIAELIRN